jgi:hypothetical protein
MNEIGVDLSRRDQRPNTPITCCTEFLEKGRPIAFDCGTRIIGKAKIQRASAVSPGEAANPCAKAMYEPRDAGK